MENIRDLMIQLADADPETVNRIAWEKGSLPVRLAMLGLASAQKEQSPIWFGNPPGVFISYKWDGAPMRDLVTDLAQHIRKLGYQVFLDIENLDADADAYFQIPQFISSVQECTFYILLLTELSADLMTGRKGKTTWIHDEFQHAVRLANSGRLVMVPVLLEPKGMPDFFTPDQVIDLTGNKRRFEALHDILTPHPVTLNDAEKEELKAVVAQFDATFLKQKWEESAQLLQHTQHLAHTFDHQFRDMLHSLYTANGQRFETKYYQLCATYGERLVLHFYKGYCAKHQIPVRINGK